MKETVRLGRYLLIICAVAGVALALTNQCTAKRIEKQKTASKNSSFSEVLPAAVSFRVIGSSEDAYEGLDENNRRAGYVLAVSTDGYSSRIQALVGINKKYVVTGVRILSQQETPGLGAGISEKSFLSQFVGKIPGKVRLKKDGGSIDGITSATISSRAITDAIRNRIDEFRKNKK